MSQQRTLNGREQGNEINELKKNLQSEQINNFLYIRHQFRQMKIKRTLPSIQDILHQNDKKEKSRLQQSQASEQQNHSHINFVQPNEHQEEQQIINRLNSDRGKIFKSPVRQTSRLRNNLSINANTVILSSSDNVNDFESQQFLLKKESQKGQENQQSEVTFKEEQPHSFKHEGDKNAQNLTVEDLRKSGEGSKNTMGVGIFRSNSISERGVSRKKIFTKKTLQINLDDTNSISAPLCNRSVSGKTVQKIPQSKEEREDLLKKLNSLEIVVRELAEKLEKQPQSIEGTPINRTLNDTSNSGAASRLKSSSYHNFRVEESGNSPYQNQGSENKRLRLELEQMKRCEKIAQENQMLYSRLVGSMSGYGHNESITLMKVNQAGSSHLHFQDFDGNEEGSHISPTDEENYDITSPFLLEENNKSAAFHSRGSQRNY